MGEPRVQLTAETLFASCVERNLRVESSVLSAVLSQASYAQAWDTLLKWMIGQFEGGKAVNCPPMGVFGYHPNYENPKLVCLDMNDVFKQQYGLTFKLDEQDLPEKFNPGPAVKVSFQALSKSGNLEKQVMSTALTNIFQVIGEILASYNHVEIDLGVLGKLESKQSAVTFKPAAKPKTLNLLGKKTVKNLMKTSKTLEKLPPLEPVVAFNDKVSSFKKNPTARRNPVPHGELVVPEMLGAGTNPLSRLQAFSSLANDPVKLLQTTFKKPPLAQTKFPPVIDIFSRTQAAPLSANKQYLPPSVRIASNYNPSAKRLIIDVESRSIKFLPFESTITLAANINPIIPQKPTSDSSLIHAEGKDSETLRRDYCWKRYRHYIESEINTEHIAPIRQYWIHHILDLVPGDLEVIPKEQVEYILDQMLNEINIDYYTAGRKAIMDYILKDDEQAKRLGIEFNPDPPCDYGSKPYEGLEPNEEWQTSVMMARMLMSDNLCICSPATLGLNMLWAEYEKMHLIDLPQRFETLTTHEFIERQEEKMKEVRSLLENEWTQSAVNIITEEIKHMDREQASTFFDACSTLMSNQLRQLITDTVNLYVEFFTSFDIPKCPHPKSMIKNNPRKWPDAFLKMKMSASDGRFVFSDDPKSVYIDILKVIESIVEQSESIPRPDHIIERKDNKNFLWSVSREDEIVNDAISSIKDIVRKNLDIALESLSLYDKYIHLLSDRKKIEQFISEDRTQKEYKEMVNKYVMLEKEIRKNCPVRIRLNMVQVECQDINKQLCKECDDIVYLLCKSILNRNSERATSIYKEFESIEHYFSNRADTPEKLVDYEEHRDKCRDKLVPNLFKEYNDVKEWFKMLLDSLFNVGEDDLGPLKQCKYWVNRILHTLEDIDNKVRNDRDTLETQLKETRKNFGEELQSIENEINKLKNASERSLYKDYCTQITNLKERLEEAQMKMEDINQREELLGWQPSEFSKLEEAKRNIKPYDELWKLVAQTKEKSDLWMNAFVRDLDADEIERESKQMLATARKLENTFKDRLPKPAEVALLTRNEIEKNRTLIPVMRIVSTPGLEDRHFEQIAKVLDLSSGSFRIDPTTTFKQVQSFHLEQFVEAIEDIAQSAAREFSNFKMLEKMERDWEPVQFELKDWQETQTYIHLGAAIEIIQQLLDEQILTTQTMKGSPFAKVYITRINAWDDRLTLSNNIINVWLKVQLLWIALEPVFASADIQKQLYKEAALFKEVDSHWRRIMEQTRRDTTVSNVIKIENLLDTLTYCEEKLEIVQKELNNYLEKKRLFFPRFFFLSNEELLSILKETRDPKRVQPHLKKCFEGIKNLAFDEDNKISAMISQEGEKVDFVRIIDPAAAEGAVERWLIDVEDCMLKSTREMILKSLTDYPKKERKNWVPDHRGQAVLYASMAFWTRGAEEKLSSQGRFGLQQYMVECDKLFKDIVELVRGNVDDLLRCTLKAMIVLDVHCRDVIKDLVDEGIEDKNDFSWLAQLRYYWENDNALVRILNAELDYNYEYLGNSERLVITPLTDRCYRTLCGAVYLYYGGAPEGPAGTGKTETVKDLAKALARMCVVFNCSDGLDYKAMGKFFKGLAATGGWSCFDEFNRIDAEVLSVIAQQLLEIQNAIKESKVEFVFEGTTLPIKKTCNCFITMNPGYAGRTELPDNLKALFRTVAMMVPDYALISENVLYSYGFQDARPLARKIVATYKLCSEQLSSQDHYDYGMRAVKSVLVAAGNLKRRYPDQDESELMLRAINDVNLAKFLSHDLPLFQGITSDLFPGVVLPPPDYRDLLQALNNQCAERNLQTVDYFMMKVIQLYEMICVRHGLMVVGLPFSGKTTAIHVLAGALTELSKKSLMNEYEVIMYTLNPKSITNKQLYGNYDPVSKDWQDGVLAKGYKEFAKNETNVRKWMIFDGPVDARWIEDMNTVLDDNKKLCLNSGEIIAMSQNMNLIFEPMDLAVASPATVSRCGMVYLEPHKMGWEPLYRSWRKNAIPKTFLENEDMEVTLLVDWLIEPTLEQINSKMRLIAPSMQQNLVVSLLRLFGTLIRIFDDTEYFDSIEEKDRIKIIDCLFLFSMTWSLGASVISSDRRSYNIFLRRLLGGDIPELKNKGKKIQPSLPESGSHFDYIFLADQMAWRHWTEAGITDINALISPKLQVNEIIVPTVDTVRYTYLLDKMVKANIPVLLCGNTGTGKTSYVKEVITNKLDPNVYISVEIGFSAQTNANQVQDIIDSKVDMRRKKGVFGPPPGKICLIFVDDLNMPEKETYGAQPPVEILRQLIDSGGWYERKDMTFKKLIETRFVSAMGPPGGGRTFITPRFQRHLNMVALADFEDDTLLRIFSSILHWFFVNNKFNENVTKLENKIVQASRDIYKTAMEKLLPTPLKSHYTFNLRDFAKVIVGICMSDAQTIHETEQVVRLWVHEILRVFGDRLISDEDRMWLLSHIRESVKRIYGLNFDNIFNHLDIDKDGKVETLDEIRRLMFGFMLSPPGAPRHYVEITDLNELQRKVEESLEMYNSTSDRPMDLVMFSFALEHLCRISRVLNQPGGHALLIGVGGSGRQSLTRLAAFISEFDVVQIELTKNYGKNEWQEDLKRILRKAGGRGEPTVFLFTDSQIKDKSFLEDINTLLNTGEVPNLFPAEEKIEVTELVRPAAKSEGKAADGTPAQLFNFFIQRCKKMMHVVLCFSPIGEAFRTRLRMFPSLVNCTTIDWFSEWPQDALVSVARKFLGSLEMEDDIREQCVEMCQFFHRTTIEYSKKMQQELRRHYYVTPTSYLEMITTFKRLLEERRNAVLHEKERFETGFEKLITTEGSVEKMRRELTDLQPKLEEAKVETDRKVIIVEAQKKEAEIVRKVVEKEEIVARAAADKAESIKRECDAELAQCMPVLEEALASLKVLNKDDITQIKGYSNPAVPIKNVMEAVCILLGVDPPKKQNPNTMKMEPQWWEASQKILSNVNFLPNLEVYDKNKITEKMIKQLQKFVNDPQFNKETISRISPAAAGLCSWVLAMEKYYHVNLIVDPKRQAQEEAQNAYNEVMTKLEAKMAESKAEQDKVDALQRDLDITLTRKEKLEKDVEDCKRRLIRAQQLIESLGGEKVSWNEKAKRLGEDYINLTGDVIISSGIIAYCGPFTAAFRGHIIENWIHECKVKAIPSGKSFSLQSCLGDPVKIRSWNIDGLPRDAFSIDNAIIISKAKRWPLMIDPECQANKWIKKMEGKENTLLILKLTDDNFLRYLENKIISGHPVLLENVGEELDPSLEPLLLKQIVKNEIKLGDKPVEYNKDFRLYITTRFRNPHYLPELSTKVTLLNFMITPEGLADQLLVTVVAEEEPELARTKEQLILRNAENQHELKKIQDRILHVLSTTQGNILDDDEAIQILSQSKVVSNQIEEEQARAKTTEEQIDHKRMEYKPFSDCMSLLFFCITELNNIDPMYQYSIDFYNQLFLRAIRESEKANEINQRLAILKRHFTKSLYVNICRSLFEKDRLLFAFSLTLKFMEYDAELDLEELRFFMTGGLSLDEKPPEKPSESWVLGKMWQEVCKLNVLHKFRGFRDHFDQHIKEWQEVYESRNPYTHILPGHWHEFLNPFEKLLIVRVIRPDAIISAVSEFVGGKLGSEFTEPLPFKLKDIYNDSSRTTPLIFILSPGSDPFRALKKFADSKRKNLETRSLGQGQGVYAKELILRSLETGDWVLLQNCHLATSWMPTLEKIVADIQPEAKGPGRDFRLWLTSYPSSTFPVTLLQNGMKMTNEPPKGLKANLMGSFMKDFISDPTFFNGCKKESEWKKLLFGLCFFNAVIQERRLYGPLGWNIPYEFTESDLRISVQQLQIFLNQYDKVPFKALKYLTGECNFGGRVTDDKDRRLIMTLLDDYYTADIFHDDYRFANILDYYAPPTGEFQDYINYIENLPNRSQPEIYGLHPNADLTKYQNEAVLLFDNLLLTNSSSSGGEGGGSSLDAIVTKIAENILGELPEAFNEEIAGKRYPPLYEESMNTVLTQELHRFNILTDTIKTSMLDLQKAIKGQISMSAIIESTIRSLFDNRVPRSWMKNSYPSLKPLGSYISDLRQRLDFFKDWLTNGPPIIFSISKFFFTQSFLTGAMQNYARKYTIPIDECDFNYEIISQDNPSRPKDGVIISGMFLEGARWDSNKNQLSESHPKVLFSDAPLVWLKPGVEDEKFPHYKCPLYRTSERKGVLSTTGHSTNFVMFIKLATDIDPKHWVKRGVALLTQLDD
jgi:dynein heavy chain